MKKAAAFERKESKAGERKEAKMTPAARKKMESSEKMPAFLGKKAKKC